MTAHRIRVLLVDDDALVRAGLTMMLDGANGIEVVGEAADGDQVPAAVDAHAPDVVLMDLRMPRTDGITATRRLMDRAVATSGTREQARAALADLTPREHEVVVGIARGETNAEISARLFMSVATVKAHITHILTKLGLTNRTQIALLAHDADLV